MERRHGGVWNPWPTCNARSSMVSTRTASRSRSGRSSSRSWSSSSPGGQAGSRRRGDIRPSGRPARGRLAVGVAADLVPGLADLDPDRARSSRTRSPQVVAADTDACRHPRVGGRSRRHRRPSRALRRPAADPVRCRARSRPAPFHGTDDFHFGRGTATIIETAPGTYHLASRTSRSATARTCSSTSRPTPTTTPRCARARAGSRRPTAPSATTSRRAPTPPTSPARSSGASSSRTSSRSLRWAAV